MNFPVSSKLVFQNGKAHIQINGINVPPVVYGLSDIPASKTSTAQAQRNIANFAKAGVNLVQIDTDLRYCWLPSGKIDIATFQREIAGALKGNPEALVLVRLHLNPPVWWMDAHPEEMNMFWEGPGEALGEEERLIGRDFEKVRRVSLASRLWMAEGGDVLRRVLQELQGTEEGGHVVAIQVACGVYGEWHQWGCMKYSPDYSQSMLRRFREYLQEKYGDDDGLRSAWGRADVSIATAEIPPPERRLTGDDGAFRGCHRFAEKPDAFRCRGDFVLWESCEGELGAGGFGGVVLRVFLLHECALRDGRALGTA